jgi:hypothetical protein
MDSCLPNATSHEALTMHKSNISVNDLNGNDLSPIAKNGAQPFCKSVVTCTVIKFQKRRQQTSAKFYSPMEVTH